jgi:fatty acid desaturase
MTDERVGLLLGMATSMAVIGTVQGIRRWHARHHRHDGEVR